MPKDLVEPVLRLDGLMASYLVLCPDANPSVAISSAGTDQRNLRHVKIEFGG
jgi:hypothetical protein